MRPDHRHPASGSYGGFVCGFVWVRIHLSAVSPPERRPRSDGHRRAVFDGVFGGVFGRIGAFRRRGIRMPRIVGSRCVKNSHPHGGVSRSGRGRCAHRGRDRGGERPGAGERPSAVGAGTGRTPVASRRRAAAQCRRPLFPGRFDGSVAAPLRNFGRVRDGRDAGAPEGAGPAPVIRAARRRRKGEPVRPIAAPPSDWRAAYGAAASDPVAPGSDRTGVPGKIRTGENRRKRRRYCRFSKRAARPVPPLTQRVAIP